MAISRNYNYNESTRPKLSRNIYDHIYDSKSESNSVFASTGGGYVSTSVVGGEMAPIEDFVGAINATDLTPGQDGVRGLVPAPVVGDAMKFLQGSGGWVRIPAFEWFTEFPSNSTTKTGLQMNGDLNVTQTLSAQTLRVEGAAHFWSLLVDEAKANGGSIYVSPALFEVDYVAAGERYSVSGSVMNNILSQRDDIAQVFSENNVTCVNTKRAYMRCDDNQKRTRNECIPGDMMRCHTFNLDGFYAGQTYNNIGNKDYWTFVVEVSNGAVDYTLPDGTVQKCFWIDLADYLELSGGGIVPLGSSLDWTGNVIIDPNQNTDINLHDLKVQAQRTYNGSTTADNETGSTSDYIDIIASIYGMSDTISYVANGTPSGTRSSSISQDTFDQYTLLQVQYGLNQITTGEGDTYNDGIDAVNMSNLIMDETLGNDIPTQSDLDSADSLTYDILGTDAPGDIYFTEEESEEVTSSGMNRAPVYRAAVSNATGSAQGNEKWLFGYCGTRGFALEVGDQLASFGHLFDGGRMDAIVISAITPIDSTLTAPAIAQYVGINEFGEQLGKFRTTAIAANGNSFQGSLLVTHNGTLMDINERINLFITDLNTGLETVGIHLDGENSLMKLIGSVEIRQHDGNNYDTLTVWDSNSNKKVEITPKSIPALSSIQSNLVMEQNNTLPIATYYKKWNKTNSDGYIDSEWNQALFDGSTGTRHWKYWLNSATKTFTTEVSLGDLVSGDQLTIGSTQFSLDCPILSSSSSSGSVDIDDSANALSNDNPQKYNARDGQEITSFIMRIKRNGSYITGATTDIKNNYAQYLNENLIKLKSKNININITEGIKINNQSTITIGSGNYYAGNYSVEFSFTLKYAGIFKDFVSKKNEVANPWMSTTSTFTGSIHTTIQRSTANADAFMQIGNNGLAFSMGANKLMYASDSAMKFNWKSSSWLGTPSDGVGIEFSNDYGLQIKKNVKTYSAASNSIDAYVDVAIINCSGRTSVSVTLPSAANYGNGRMIELICTNTNSLTNGYNSVTITSSSSVFGKNHNVTVTYGDSPQYTGIYWDNTFKFVAAGSIWYEL